MRELKELQVARQALVKDRTRLLNRIKTRNIGLVVRQGKARLALIERQLRDIDADICRRIEAEKPTARAFKIIKSIPGLGAVSAAAVRIPGPALALRAFGADDHPPEGHPGAPHPEIGTLNRKQGAGLAGLAPMTRQSGLWKGKAFIQGGRKHLRDALYMPAIVAMRFNPDLKAICNKRRGAGKPAKVAITALMRKLIELANTLVKADRIWMPKGA